MFLLLLMCIGSWCKVIAVEIVAHSLSLFGECLCQLTTSFAFFSIHGRDTIVFLICIHFLPLLPQFKFLFRQVWDHTKFNMETILPSLLFKCI